MSWHRVLLALATLANHPHPPMRLAVELAIGRHLRADPNRRGAPPTEVTAS